MRLRFWAVAAAVAAVKREIESQPRPRLRKKRKIKPQPRPQSLQPQLKVTGASSSHIQNGKFYCVYYFAAAAAAAEAARSYSSRSRNRSNDRKSNFKPRLRPRPAASLRLFQKATPARRCMLHTHKKVLIFSNYKHLIFTLKQLRNFQPAAGPFCLLLLHFS